MRRKIPIYAYLQSVVTEIERERPQKQRRVDSVDEF